MAFKMYDNKTAMKKLFGDLNKDGKMSSYEQTRQDAIEKNMAGDSPNKMYGKSPKKKYKSDAQRKAVHASKAESAMKNYMNPEEYKVFNMGNSPKKMYGKKKK